MELLNKVRKELELRVGEPSGLRFLLAVSGGKDSVVLAQLFHDLRLNFSIAHCNFCLRDQESDEDESFVVALAHQLECGVFIRRFETKEFAGHQHLSIQEAARVLRYQFFRELKAEHGFDYIVTAHHRNDQVETLLINLVRGTGLRGLTGMSALDNDLLRPMLSSSPEEISAFAQENQLKWREDSSNSSEKYLRNKIRHKVIPELENARFGALSRIAETADHLREIREFLTSCLQEIKKEVVSKKGKEFTIDLKKIKAHSHGRLVLFELLRDKGFNKSQTDEILKLDLTESGKQFFSEDHRAVVNRGSLQVLPHVSELRSEFLLQKGGERLQTVSFQLEWEIFENPQPISPDPWQAFLDAERVSFPLILRRWEAGDQFQPLGMKGRKKLSDFFIDLKLSLPEKERIWVLTSENEIIWVPGLRIDERYKVTSETRRMLHFRMLQE